MNKIYEELDKLRNRNPVLFTMAIVQTLISGTDSIKQITDEEIEKAQGNALMTDSFVKDLWKTSKDIVNLIDGEPIKLFCYVQAAELLDVSDIRLSYDQVKKAAQLSLMDQSPERIAEICDACDIWEDDVNELLDVDVEYEDATVKKIKDHMR